MWLWHRMRPVVQIDMTVVAAVDTLHALGGIDLQNAEFDRAAATAAAAAETDSTNRNARTEAADADQMVAEIDRPMFHP